MISNAERELRDALHAARRAAIDAQAAAHRAKGEAEQAGRHADRVGQLLEEAERYVGIDLDPTPGEVEPDVAA